ncbi:MAG: hypothetical protein ACSHW0_18875 [Thalassotalea sp.]
MPKLTPEQIRLLVWLSKPTSFIEITREHHLHEHLYNGLHNYRDSKGGRNKFDIRTLNALDTAGFVTCKTVYYCGLAWQRYTISDSGKLFALNVTGIVNA